MREGKREEGGEFNLNWNGLANRSEQKKKQIGRKSIKIANIVKHILQIFSENIRIKETHKDRDKNINKRLDLQRDLQ